METIFWKLSILMLFYNCTTALIIPEDIANLIGQIYPIIPPIKKGTDSRIGIGFRLGEHADFQILIELGPQTETEPIGNIESKRRRMITYGAAMRGELGPWAQAVAKHQTQLKIRKELERIEQMENKLARVKFENSEKIDRKMVSSDDWLTKLNEDSNDPAEADTDVKRWRRTVDSQTS